MIVEDHPGTIDSLPERYMINIQIAKANAIKMESVPNDMANFNGFLEKPKIPAEANENIFSYGNISFCRQHVRYVGIIGVCLNPIQLKSPRKYLCFSGNCLNASKTLRSMSLKSPVSTGNV